MKAKNVVNLKEEIKKAFALIPEIEQGTWVHLMLQIPLLENENQERVLGDADPFGVACIVLAQIANEQVNGSSTEVISQLNGNELIMWHGKQMKAIEALRETGRRTIVDDFDVEKSGCSFELRRLPNDKVVAIDTTPAIDMSNINKLMEDAG